LGLGGKNIVQVAKWGLWRLGKGNIVQVATCEELGSDKENIAQVAKVQAQRCSILRSKVPK
jgi:hypothetical protein